MLKISILFRNVSLGQKFEKNTRKEEKNIPKRQLYILIFKFRKEG